MTFIDIYDKEYAPLIGESGTWQRRDTFRTVYVALANAPAVIVETGTARTEGNWSGDGQSTIQFDRYVRECGGHFWSCDINPAPEYVQKAIGPNTELITQDSIPFLEGFVGQVDLLYLDSLDGNFGNTAEHQLNELQTAGHMLKSGSIVFHDDISTKGRLIIPYLETKAKLLCKGVTQAAWIWP